MSVPTGLSRSAALLLALAVAACARPLQRTQAPRPGTQLERVEELPAAPAEAGAPGAGFAAACAMRLRDGGTGREYLLLRSEVRRTVAETDTLTTSTLASAVGDSGPVPEGGAAGRPAAQVRVDCTTSRVLSVLDRDT